MKRETASTAFVTLNRRDWAFTYQRNWGGADEASSTIFAASDTFSKHIPGYALVLVVDLVTDAYKVYAAKEVDGMSKLTAPPEPAHKPRTGKAREGAAGVALANDLEKELKALVDTFNTAGMAGLQA